MGKFSPIQQTAVCILSLSLLFGCADTDEALKHNTAAPSQVRQEVPSYQGKIAGVSEKAKTVSIVVGPEGKTETFMLKFTPETKGMEFAKKEDAAIITYETRGADKIALEVKPKLAKLPEGVVEIKTAAVKELIDSKTNAVIIDSRPESRFDQGHLPGAISIPVAKLKEQQVAVLPADKNAALIFYCGGLTCTLSTTNAEAARKLGYTNVKVYLEGEPAWAKAGYHLYASDSYIQKGNIVLIDLRQSNQAVAGRIPRSVSVPYEKLAKRINDIPRNAPVVLYGADENEVMTASRDLKQDGFQSVSLVEGNFAGWVARKGAVESGSISSTDIHWVRTLGKGEVSKEDFKKATEGLLPNTVVVDARTKDEVAELGIFKNTVNIPLDEIPARMSELPKDKKIFIHCSTGARADLAYQELIKHGYDVKFLLLNINDAACDCPIIRP